MLQVRYMEAKAGEKILSRRVNIITLINKKKNLGKDGRVPS